jgi:hypothetical protein
VRKRCWNSHKMARNWLKRFRNTRIEIWHYKSPVDKENSSWKKRV